MKKVLYIFSILMMSGLMAIGQKPEDIFQAAGSPANPKVDVSWNRYYDYEGVKAILEKLVKAHSSLAEMNSIGKSYEGRDLWMITITGDTKVPELDKPGFYIDGNIHSNEIQGTEVSLYTAWYLLEMYESNEWIKELVDERVFYIVPTINPDAREDYMRQANNMHSPRSGMVPLDDDGDGTVNEDGYDDLDGDGHVTMMRRKDPNGRYKTDPEDERRMVMAEPDEAGEYELLGFEGIDRDGDGRVNEDGTGRYDPNRDWGWNWQPDYIQGGAYKYPFSLPENRAVADFVLAHPNIAGAQSYHNYGGMILRGPGAQEDADTYNREDERIYDAIGKRGDEMMPGYRYMVVWKDLYSVFGGELDWFYGGRGIYTFTNELFTNYFYFNRESGGWSASQADQYKFDKYLLFEDAFVEWKTYQHPQFGEVEIGGFKKNFTRANPGFLLEQDAHRNMAFSLYHAYQMPKLVIEKVEEEDLGGGLTAITATIANKRLMPTHSSQDVKNKIERPDYVTLKGRKVEASMVVLNKDFNKTKEQKRHPEKIEVENIPGMGTTTVRWIVSNKGKYSIEVNSAKGGTVKKDF